MEKLSNKPPPYRNPHYVTKNTAYDDVFGGPPRFGVVPSLSPRIEDYAEIFGGLRGASRVATSIPVLDLPPADLAGIPVSFSERHFDYSEVFGGFDGQDFAVTFEELMEQSKASGDCDSSDEAWTPAQSETLSDESEPFACTDRYESMPNAELHQSNDGIKQFKVSYNRVFHTNKDDVANGVAHVTQLNDVPGYSFLVNAPPPPQKMVVTNNLTHEDVVGGLGEGKRLRKTTSCDNKSFVTISDISLKTRPSHLPPPSRPPPDLDPEERDSNTQSSKIKASKSIAFGEITSADSSPLFYDVEVDATTSAAVSAAAMKDVMEKAQEKLKSAKHRKDRSKKVSERDLGGVKGFADNAREHGKGYGLLQESLSKIEGNVEWKQDEEFYEVVETDDNRNLFGMGDDQRVVLDNLRNDRDGQEVRENQGISQQEEVNRQMESDDEIHEKIIVEAVESEVLENMAEVRKKETKDEGRFEDNLRLEENEMRLRENVQMETTEIATNDYKLLETLEREENEKKEREACEGEEKEKREKEASERELKEKIVREAIEKEENEKRLRLVLEEKVKKLREAWEREEKEIRENKVCERDFEEKRLREAIEKEEKEKRSRLALEEKERKQREACEREENEEREKEARESEEKEMREKEALDREEKEKREKEACEREVEDKRIRKALEEKEKKQREACEREEREKREKESRKREIKEKIIREAIEQEENEKRLKIALEKEENEKQKLSREGNGVEKKLKDDLRRQNTEEEPNSTLRKEENKEKVKERCALEEDTQEVLLVHEREVNGKRPKEAFEHEDIDKMWEEDCRLDEKVAFCGTGNKLDKNSGEAKKTKAPFFVEDTTSIEAQVDGLNSSGVARDGLQDKKIETRVGESKESLPMHDTVFEFEKKPLKKTGSFAKPNVVSYDLVEGVANSKKVLVGKDKKVEKFTSSEEVKGKVQSQNAERKGKSLDDVLSREEKEREERMNRERKLENERLRKIEGEREREREREKDRMAVDMASLERATADARLAEARERLEKANAEARLRAERAAVERATAEARERAFQKAKAGKVSVDSRERVERMMQSSLQSDSCDGVGSTNGTMNAYSSVHGRVEVESAERCKARLERHQRTAQRAAKALEEKNMRDLVAHRELAERNRLAEGLDAEVKRWSSGKEGNLRALLSTLQYILGPDSGWKALHLTEVITSAAVKTAYRKATLCVHPDKLQQRGASIHQKYVCEKVFDLLKAAWNKFNSEER